MADLTKLGKYELRRELGKGAMGVVYEGFDPFIERTVAIKTVLKSALDGDEAQEMLNRFRREAQAAGRLTHPNIVAIYEYGEDQDVAFIAMEFIKGKELKKYFDSEERFQMPDVVRIMSQLLEALEYSHDHGVVHRDIKPANIIITDAGQVKVADFGIARIESSHLTQVGTVLGTPTHMSPEQFMGLAVDCRTDIYSSGVILYQFLTGERPFTGSVVTIMHKALNQDPVPPSALNFNVTPALDNVVKKAMAKRLEERFQTANEFLDALKAAVSGNAVVVPVEMVDPDATFVSNGPVPLGSVQANSDLELWKSIKSSQSLDDIRRYLTQYPDGKFVELAKLRITAIEATAMAEAEAEAEAEDEARAEEEARRKAAEEKAKRETEAKLKAKEEARLKREVEERLVREAADALHKKEAEEIARREQEVVEARIKAEEEARRQVAAEEKARLAREAAEAEVLRIKEAEEIARREREAVEARIKAEEEARRQIEAEEKARLAREAAEAEVLRIKEAEEIARREREAVEARIRAEEEARRQAEAKENARLAKEAEDAKAKARAAEKAWRERDAAETKAKAEKARRLKEEEEKAQRARDAAEAKAAAKERQQRESEAKRVREAAEAKAVKHFSNDAKGEQDPERTMLSAGEQDAESTVFAGRAPVIERAINSTPGVSQAPATPAKKSPVLAIAGGVAVLVVGAGIWLATRPASEKAPVVETIASTPAPQSQTLPPVSKKPVDAAQERAAKEKMLQEKQEEAVRKANSDAAVAAKEKAVADNLAANKAKADSEAALARAKTDSEKQAAAKSMSEAKAAVAKAKADAEAANKAKAEADAAKAKAKAESNAKAEAEARAKADEAKRKAEADAKAEAEARAKAEEAKRKAEAEAKSKVAVTAPAPAAPTPPSVDMAPIYQQGVSLEASGSILDAMKLYKIAANANYVPAMKKLGDIYGKGIGDTVPRDYVASIKWYNKAKQAGAEIDSNFKR